MSPLMERSTFPLLKKTIASSSTTTTPKTATSSGTLRKMISTPSMGSSTRIPASLRSPGKERSKTQWFVSNRPRGVGGGVALHRPGGGSQSKNASSVSKLDLRYSSSGSKTPGSISGVGWSKSSANSKPIAKSKPSSQSSAKSNALPRLTEFKIPAKSSDSIASFHSSLHSPIIARNDVPWDNRTDQSMPPLLNRGNWSSIDSSASSSSSSGGASYSDRSRPSFAFDDRGIEPYGLTSTVLTAIPVGIIIFIIVAGNALVIAAVLKDSRLKRQVQNWLIVSVAAADLFVGLLIMPLTLTYELLDEWALGDVLCELWLALDVLFVTASILNLCAISLDRYWSLTAPTSYPQKRTPRRMLLMIVAVWLMAFAISFPPLVGWRPENRAASACFLSDQLGYVLYSSLGSFFVPTLVLLFVYARIYCITRKRSSNRKRPAATGPKSGGGEEKSYFAANGGVGARTSLLQRSSIPTIVEPPVAQPINKNRPRKKYTSDSIGSTNDFMEGAMAMHSGGGSSGSTAFLVNGANPNSPSLAARQSLAPEYLFTENDYAVLIAKIRSMALDGRNMSIISHDGFMMDSNNSSPEHHHHNQLRLNQGRRALSIVASIANEAAALSRQQQQREDPLAAKAMELKKQLLQRQKLVRRRERQATLVLGLVLGAFIGSWMPFFSSYLLSAFGLRTPDLLFDLIFWLGYCNSGLNPFIYNFFNPDFRRAFQRILRAPLDKLRRRMSESGGWRRTLLLLGGGGDRRRSSAASALMANSGGNNNGGADGGENGDRNGRRKHGGLMPLRHTVRRGAVFSPKHPYLRVKQQYQNQQAGAGGARQSLISNAPFDNLAMNDAC